LIAIDQEQVLERLPLKAEIDIVHIRQLVRFRGKQHGMGLVDQTRITTAASEILRNMYVYAQGGEAVISLVTVQGRRGLLVTCRDEGPGIPDIELAMQDGYSTANSLGCGLPGARRLVDNLDLDSVVGQGTTVQLLKYLP
jgi:serine/threonine-protein kinase RsbT